MNLRPIRRGLVALVRKLMFWRRPEPEPASELRSEVYRAAARLQNRGILRERGQ